MIATLWAWLTAADHWTGPDGIPTRVGEHLLYSAAVVLIAAAIAVPAGLWVGHTGRGRWLVSAANAARAVPTIGLLFAVSLWLGPVLRRSAGLYVPSLIVLVLLAIPPLLAGVYAGLAAVDPAVRDAARGVGMRPGQVLRDVEIPCALPLFLSGLKSAVLQVIATATIAAYLGLGGLGRYLFDGIAAGDYAQAAGGAVLVSVLAVLGEGALAVLQRAVVSPGLGGGLGTARRSGPGNGNASGRRGVDAHTVSGATSRST